MQWGGSQRCQLSSSLVPVIFYPECSSVVPADHCQRSWAKWTGKQPRTANIFLVKILFIVNTLYFLLIQDEVTNQNTVFWLIHQSQLSISCLCCSGRNNQPIRAQYSDASTNHRAVFVPAAGRGLRNEELDTCECSGQCKVKCYSHTSEICESTASQTIFSIQLQYLLQDNTVWLRVKTEMLLMSSDTTLTCLMSHASTFNQKYFTFLDKNIFPFVTANLEVVDIVKAIHVFANYD